ncbi:MAG: penicillin-binding protein, partial [Campylobacter sp.]
MKIFFAVLLAFLTAGCGYKPVSKITQDILGDPVYVDVIIS